MSIPVIFVHGTRTSSHIWEDQQRALRSFNHESIAIDLPSHGSRRDETFSIVRSYELIDQAVETYSQPPLLVGLSLGGYLSLGYGAQHSHKIAGIVASGASAETSLPGVTLWGSVSRWIDAQNTSLRKRLRPRTACNSTWYIVADMLSEIGLMSAYENVRRIQVPTLLVNGQKDILRLNERTYLSLNPLIKRICVPHAGHDVNTDQPVVYNRILLDMLDALDSGGYQENSSSVVLADTSSLVVN